MSAPQNHKTPFCNHKRVFLFFNARLTVDIILYIIALLSLGVELSLEIVTNFCKQQIQGFNPLCKNKRLKTSLFLIDAVK